MTTLDLNRAIYPADGDGKVTIQDIVNAAAGEGGSADIPVATPSADGLMSAADKSKLNGIATGATNNTLALGTSATQAAAGNHTHAAATTAVAGFMSTADKTKLDGIAASANAYTLPAATVSTLGGVKIASSTVAAGTVAALSSAADRTYMTQLNSDGQMVVNVPWVNTTYTLPAAGTTLGGVRRGAAVADATEETQLAQLNALLASLRAAGVIAT